MAQASVSSPSSGSRHTYGALSEAHAHGRAQAGASPHWGRLTPRCWFSLRDLLVAWKAAPVWGASPAPRHWLAWL